MTRFLSVVGYIATGLAVIGMVISLIEAVSIPNWWLLLAAIVFIVFSYFLFIFASSLGLIAFLQGWDDEDEKIEVGDHVTIGDFGQVHWEVVATVPDRDVALLRSGLTGKRFWADLDVLTIHTKGAK